MGTPIIDLHTAIQGEGKFIGVPHILIRTSGCNLRCIFGNSRCDTPYSSFTPEKGQYNLSDIEAMVKENSQIRHLLLTGGEPCLHPNFIERILKDFGHHIITMETNGTIFLSSEIAEQIDLVSISPKLSSSIPTKEKCNDGFFPYSETHELNHRNAIDDISQNEIVGWIIFSRDFQLKYVVNDEDDITEILGQLDEIKTQVAVPDSKVYLMPAGVTNNQLQEKRPWLMERCIELGFNYTDRLQVLAYGERRGV